MCEEPSWRGRGWAWHGGRRRRAGRVGVSVGTDAHVCWEQERVGCSCHSGRRGQGARHVARGARAWTLVSIMFPMLAVWPLCSLKQGGRGLDWPPKHTQAPATDDRRAACGARVAQACLRAIINVQWWLLTRGSTRRQAWYLYLHRYVCGGSLPAGQYVICLGRPGAMHVGASAYGQWQHCTRRCGGRVAVQGTRRVRAAMSRHGQSRVSVLDHGRWHMA